MRIEKLTLFVMTILLTCSMLSAQTFEGKIAYKIVPQNPFPEEVSAEAFAAQLKEVFGENGYMSSTYYYKGGDYASEITFGEDSGLQVYNPEDGLIYSWQYGTTSAITLDSKKTMDTFVEYVESDETDTIMGILCQVIIIKTTLGEMKVWYNPDYFKVDPALFEGHVYGQFDKMLEKTGSLPIKTEAHALNGHLIMTMLDYKEEAVEDSIFILPEFTEVTANPAN